jgi:hypothetical protein
MMWIQISMANRAKSLEGFGPAPQFCVDCISFLILNGIDKNPFIYLLHLLY